MGKRDVFKPKDIRVAAGERLARAHAAPEEEEGAKAKEIRSARAAYDALMRFPPLT
jgi:hypothetical protein